MPKMAAGGVETGGESGWLYSQSIQGHNANTPDKARARYRGGNSELANVALPRGG